MRPARGSRHEGDDFNERIANNLYNKAYLLSDEETLETGPYQRCFISKQNSFRICTAAGSSATDKLWST